VPLLTFIDSIDLEKPNNNEVVKDLTLFDLNKANVPVIRKKRKGLGL
jgi:hypothetical protein